MRRATAWKRGGQREKRARRRERRRGEPGHAVDVELPQLPPDVVSAQRDPFPSVRLFEIPCALRPIVRAAVEAWREKRGLGRKRLRRENARRRERDRKEFARLKARGVRFPDLKLGYGYAPYIDLTWHP